MYMSSHQGESARGETAERGQSQVERAWLCGI